MKKNNLISYTDEELFTLVSEVSDEHAFAQLYDRHWKRLFLIAKSKVGDRQVSEGIVQDLYTNIWKRRKKVKIQKNFQVYMNTALRYVIINHYRHIKVTQDYARMESLTTKLNAYNTERLVSFNELFSTIQTEIDTLPNRCSEIFKMSRYDNMSNKEIAEHLNISHKTVENQITKAIRVLRINLKELISILFAFWLP
ncbi:MAG: RNA polymerase sigma-70 factor [Cryomorphaceae bacterium]